MTLRGLVAMLHEDAEGEFKDHLDKEVRILAESDGDPLQVLSMYVEGELVFIDVGEGD